MASRTPTLWFRLSTTKDLDILASGYPKSAAIPCDSAPPVDDIKETLTGMRGRSYYASTETMSTLGQQAANGVAVGNL